MPESRTSGVRRHPRVWRFADCVFDEANWSLTVAGQRAAIETKPLELLRELLLHAGDLVSKDELLDRIWPDVTVVEASLPTAVHKLRHALNDEFRNPHIIQTVPRIGYRLAVPAEAEELCATAEPARSTARSPGATGLPAAMAQERPALRGAGRLYSVAGALALASVIMGFSLGPSYPVAAVYAQRGVSQTDARNALRRLDIRSIESMIAEGWDPNRPFDNEGNGAINYVLNRCEWDHGNNQEQILLVVRTLVEAGAKIDRRNIWGDTPYSIAKAARYCGPNHPVTRALRAMCYEGSKPLGDRCLASYEIARRNRARPARETRTGG